MKKGITPFIPENIAPSNASKLVIFEGDTKLGYVNISNMRPTGLGKKSYSFGLVSDVHLAGNNSAAGIRLDNALTYFEKNGASFCCHCGDITNIGFWYPISEADGTSYYYPDQFDEFVKIRKKHGIPIYGNCGNHESYNGYDIVKTYTDVYGADPTLVVNNLEKLQDYTGNGLVFTETNGTDVFIFVGQSTQTLPMTVDHLQWLYERLEENRNQRCFVFIHPYVSLNDSGNPLGLHSLPLFNTWGATNTKAFTDMMAHYKNTILFHGHSHVHFDTQHQVSHAIYSENLGFRSVHVPSTANGRKIINGALGDKDTNYGLCYLVEVYENNVVLRGYDVAGGKEDPIGQYCIDTTLQTIEEGTFTDTTGVIKT